MRTLRCTAAGERKKNQESPPPPPGGFIVARAVARRRHPFPRVPHRTRPCNDSFNGNLRNSCLRTYAVGGIVRAGSSACRGDLGGVISSAPPSPHLRVRASPSPHRHRRPRHRKHCQRERQGRDHEIPPIGPGASKALSNSGNWSTRPTRTRRRAKNYRKDHTQVPQSTKSRRYERWTPRLPALLAF